MRFKEYRESQRISPVQAAKQLAVSYGTIWRWETGLATPTRTKQLLIQDWSGGVITPADWDRGPENNAEDIFQKAATKTVKTMFGEGATIAKTEMAEDGETLNVLVNVPVEQITITCKIEDNLK